MSDADWFYNEVAYVYEKGIMTGINDTTFASYTPLARAQFALILCRMEGEPEIDYQAVFPDVPEGIWYTDAVMWANQNGIITGYGDTGMFGGGDPINREQMAVMMYRYAKYKGYDANESADLSSYQDAAYVNDFAKEAMQWAVADGIITGKYDQTVLDPQGNASRAECATIIMRFISMHICRDTVSNLCQSKERTVGALQNR